MKGFGKNRDAQPVPVAPADAIAALEEFKFSGTARAIVEMRVACLQEAIKRHGENDRRGVLVIAKEFETWCLTGDNTAALVAARAAGEALQPAVADDKRQ